MTTFCVLLVCRLRAKYGVCFQSGSISIVTEGYVSLYVCAMYMAYSHAFVSLLGWNSGSESVVPVQAVLVRGSAVKSLSSGSSE